VSETNESSLDPPPSAVRPLTIAAAIARTCAIGLYLVTGTTLGLFFGGPVIVALLLPPLVLMRDKFAHRGLLASAVNDSVGVVWLAAVFTPHVSFVQWLLSYLLLAAFSFALWATTSLLVGLRMPRLLASAASTIAGMLWLSCPIWLSRIAPERILTTLLPAHPLLALNSVLKHLGIWPEQPIAYINLLNLGQDVTYQLPDSVLPGIFAHLIAGGVMLAIASALAPSPREGGLG
jgi:hypothetical protein